ncbi:MAG: hypothetical protein AAF614_17670 [Chloroflexota bacterium]
MPPEAEPRRSVLPRWVGRWLFVALGLLVAVAGLVYWQLNRRVTLATEAVEAELLAAHTLLQQVLVDEDEDLLRSMISGRDLNWVYAQINRMERNFVEQRPSFRLRFSPSEENQPSITLSPDLNEAELVTTKTYLAPTAGLGTGEIQLQQTAVYRRGQNQRWLLSPPTSEFWGEQAVLTGDRVTLRFPERDRAVAERLHMDLETAVSTVCTELQGVECGLSLRVVVSLDTNTSLLLRGSNREAMLRSRLDVVLPTPTLVGLPLDEAGYDALWQGYGGQVLTAVIAHLTGYECCDQQHFFTALIDKQLSRFGVQTWPLTTAEYDQLLLEPVDQERILRVWHSQRVSVADWRLAYAAVDFLTTDIAPNVDLVQWQREIAGIGPDRHLASLLPNQETSTIWNEGWLRFLYRQTESAQAAQPPSPWPTAALFECNTLTHTIVERFDFAQGDWREAYRIESPDNGYFQLTNHITPLPDGASFLIEQQENRVDTLHGHMLIGRGSETIMLTTLSVDVLTSHPGFYFTGESAPDNEIVLLASRDNPRLNTRHYLLDLGDCSEGDCPFALREAWSTWSPSGEQTLLAGRPPRLAEGGDIVLREWQRPLFIGDDLAWPVADIGFGGRPFWLDNEHYGSIQPNEVGVLQLTIHSATNHQPTFALTSMDLRPFVASDFPDLSIVAAQPVPNQANRILLEAHDSLQETDKTLLFMLDLDRNEQVQLLSVVDGKISYDLSPNGQWLSIQEKDKDGLVTLLHLDTGQTEQISAAKTHWGPNGRWLLREFEQHALLYSLEQPYHALMTLAHPDCRAIGWASSTHS